VQGLLPTALTLDNGQHHRGVEDQTGSPWSS
jgi:hypothetical protein